MAGQLHVPVGADNQHPSAAQFTGYELEQCKGRLVGPVEIVQYQHQGLTVGSDLPKGGDGVEQAKPSLLRL